MKSTAVIALAAMTLAVAGCTTSDPTPPGSLGALSEEEESDEDHGATGEEEGEEEGDAEGAAGEPAEGEGEDAASESQTEPEGEGEGEGSSAGGLPDPAELSDEVCVLFFDGAAPLAGRAMDSRQLVTRGSTDNLTELEYQEIDILAQRLTELGALGNEEQTDLIEKINAPFTDLQSVVADDSGQDAESGEVSYDSIDTDEAEQSQDTFTQACMSEEETS